MQKFRASKDNPYEKKRKETTAQAVRKLPTSTKEKRIPRAEAPCIPFPVCKHLNQKVVGSHHLCA
eukprot:1138485-Pelagomonas_calceolata.AAC.2